MFLAHVVASQSMIKGVVRVTLVGSSMIVKDCALPWIGSACKGQARPIVFILVRREHGLLFVSC